MSNEENELLKLYESQYTGRLFEKANSYLLERNALFDEREKLYNLLDKIKEYVENLLKEEFEITDPDNINYGEKCQRAYFSDSELEKILELLEEIK